MEFWKKFFNQPMLWGLAFVMILAIGLLVYKTPSLLMLEGGKNLFGIWVETEGSYADSDTTPNNQGFVADVLTNYPTLSGVSLSARDANGELMSQANAHYNFWVGLFVTIMLFVLVVIATRKSTSAIFILGPLLVGLIILMVVTVKSAGNMGYPDAKISLDVGGAIFDWLLWYGGVALGVFFAVKAMIRNGLIRGIDEEGPLDFSRLWHAAGTTAGTIGRTATIMGNRISQSIGDGDDTASTTLPVQQVPQQPVASKFKITRCIYCGCKVVNGRCTICQLLSNDYDINIAYGVCEREDCQAPRARGARYCYSCGQLFTPDEVDDRPDDHQVGYKYCTRCGSKCQTGNRYCGECGLDLTLPSTSYN